MRLRNANILVISFLILMYEMYPRLPLRVLCKDSKFIQDSFNHIIGYHILTIIYDDHQKDNEIKHKTLSDETKWQPTNTIHYMNYHQIRCPEISFEEIADYSNTQRF